MSESHPVIVGVMPGQNPCVIATAHRLAQQIGQGLVLVYADASQYGEGAPASTAPLDPDVIGQREDAEKTLAQLGAVAAEQLAGSGVAWRLVCAGGSPAQVLDREAKRVNASYIVIGSREPGVKAVIREALGGRVALKLSHSQPRPVVIVPQGAGAAVAQEEPGAQGGDKGAGAAGAQEAPGARSGDKGAGVATAREEPEA